MNNGIDTTVLMLMKKGLSFNEAWAEAKSILRVPFTDLTWLKDKTREIVEAKIIMGAG